MARTATARPRQRGLADEDPTLRFYLRDLSAAAEPLSRDKEIELASRIKEGDLQARNELVQANLRFVIRVAKHYQHLGLPLADLISAGNVGLLSAAGRFDGAKGYKFISFAVWSVRRFILNSIAEHARTVRLPSDKVALLRNVSRVSRRLGQARERDPDIEEIAAELDVVVDEVRSALHNARTTLSLDEASAEDEDGPLSNTLVDTAHAPPDTEVLCDSARRQLETVLNYLDNREARVLRLYYGLDGEEPLTLDKIGAGLGVTRERVRQIREGALAKLRHPTRAAALWALAGEETPVRS